MVTNALVVIPSPLRFKREGEMGERIRVEGKLFRACDLFRSTEEVRYYLNGVYVQPHPDQGALMIATDGHRMLVAYDRDGVCKKPAIVKLTADAFAPLKKDPDAKLNVSDDGIASMGFYRSEKSTFIAGTYPEWHKVLTPILDLLKKRFYGKALYEPASFNAEYLAGFKAVSRVLFDNRPGKAMHIIPCGAMDPALILIPDEPRVFGVLMPMRADIENGFPLFMRAIFEPKKRAAKKPERAHAKTKKAA